MVRAGWSNILTGNPHSLETVTWCLGSGACPGVLPWWLLLTNLLLVSYSISDEWGSLFLFWSCLPLLNFTQAESKHREFVWLTPESVISVKWFAGLWLSVPEMFSPGFPFFSNLFDSHISAFSPSLPKNFHWSFSLRGSASLLSTPLLYLRISWQSGASFAYTGWIVVMKCEGAKVNTLLLCWPQIGLCGRWGRNLSLAAFGVYDLMFASAWMRGVARAPIILSLQIDYASSYVSRVCSGFELDQRTQVFCSLKCGKGMSVPGTNEQRWTGKIALHGIGACADLDDLCKCHNGRKKCGCFVYPAVF